MTIPHLAERIEYARDELAWLQAGAKKGQEPWRAWDICTSLSDRYTPIQCEPSWSDSAKYRRRPVMLHVIDANGVRWEFPMPMRIAPRTDEVFYLAVPTVGSPSPMGWIGGTSYEMQWLAAGLCQSTEEGAQQQLAALRAVCLGGDV